MSTAGFAIKRIPSLSVSLHTAKANKLQLTENALAVAFSRSPFPDHRKGCFLNRRHVALSQHMCGLDNSFLLGLLAAKIITIWII
jgi:hypothetical protein